MEGKRWAELYDKLASLVLGSGGAGTPASRKQAGGISQRQHLIFHQTKLDLLLGHKMLK